ncbi:MAG: MBL fold metallo-hydrolase [Deltaproteobacteria bacterium]
MEIKFWGTRGSIPAPGPETLEYGGNTTCVEVVLANGQRVVIDGGTGFRLLGQHIIENELPRRFHLLLTHGHWDHLLGMLGAAKGKRVPEFAEFCRGCDLLIHDAQYLPSEIKERRGWGHSTFEEVMALARQAQAQNLLLTHHDPCRSDAELKEIVAQARKMAADLDYLHYIDAAREGSCYRLP